VHADRVTVDGLRRGVEPICAVQEQGRPIARAPITTPTASALAGGAAGRAAMGRGRAVWTENYRYGAGVN